MKFYGSSKQGEVKISDRQGLSDYLLNIEGEFEIKVTPVRDIRTTRMNNLYWWWMNLLSEHSGYSKRELHSYFKTKFLCYEDQINGETFMDCESTADLSIKRFSKYLLEIASHAAQAFEYSLPDPDHLLKSA